jgi:hypothetical protein
MLCWARVDTKFLLYGRTSATKRNFICLALHLLFYVFLLVSCCHDTLLNRMFSVAISMKTELSDVLLTFTDILSYLCVI